MTVKELAEQVLEAKAIYDKTANLTDFDRYESRCAENGVRLARAVLIYEEALKKIKDGGVDNGVLANTVERMLAMCSIADEALAKAEGLLK